MKIIVTRNTFIGGRLVEASPTPVEMTDAEGKQLIAMGKAVLAPVAVETPEAPAAPSETPAAPEEKPKRRRK